MTDCPSFLKVSANPMRELEILKNEDGNPTFSGVHGRFLSTVLEAMKLPFQVTIPEDGEWGRLLPNGNWTGMIGDICKGAADIAGSITGMSYHRSTVVDFSTVYMTDDITFAIKKAGQVPKYFAFVRPFDFITFILIFIVLLIMPLTFKYLFRYKTTYSFLLLRLIGSLFRQPALGNYVTRRFRKLTLLWLFYTTVISFSYSAVLLSMLSLPSKISPIQNFEELAKAVETDGYNFRIGKGTLPLDSMLKSDKEYLKYLGETAIRNKWYPNDGPVTLIDQIDIRTAVVTSRTKLQNIAGPEDWKFNFLSDDSFITYMLAIAMRKGFCLKEKLNTIVGRLNSAGLYMHFIQEDHFKTWLNCSESRYISIGIKPLSLEDLSGAFCILLIGLNLALVDFICEVLWLSKLKGVQHFISSMCCTKVKRTS